MQESSGVDSVFVLAISSKKNITPALPKYLFSPFGSKELYDFLLNIFMFISLAQVTLI